MKKLEFLPQAPPRRLCASVKVQLGESVGTEDLPLTRVASERRPKMSNWIDYDIDVLASSPTEMNRIAERLKKPSQELADWIAQGKEVSKIAENLKHLLEFKVVENLSSIDNAVNKARRFSIEFKARHYGIVQSHLFEVSEAFPTAIFLLDYCDMQYSYSGKQVIRAGEVIQEALDNKQRAQSVDWALLDIFAPFRAEYYGEETEFGSLWQP
jgi:hypothetical protein